MIHYLLICLLSLLFFPFTAQSSGVTPADILSGKYAKELFPEKFEYATKIEKYKQALKARKTIHRKLDSLASLEMLPLWPEEEQQKFGHIIRLAKNDLSGDVYTYLKELGTDYTFTLNKVTNIHEIYTLERAVIRLNNEIKEIENWAEKLAEIVAYWYDDFSKGQLKNDLFFYQAILSIDKDIQQVEQKYQNNIGFFILEDEQKAKGLYTIWKSRKEAIKHSPQRELLFMQLEKRFTGTFSE
jgi:hypothetical protein